MSEIFSKNVIINKSDTILMQGNGIFLLGSLDMACETHRSTNIFEDCESTKHVAIWYQKVSLHDKEFDLVTSLYRNEDEKISMKK